MEGFLCLIYYACPCESESPDSGARAGVSPAQRPGHAGVNVETRVETQVEVKVPTPFPGGQRRSEEEPPNLMPLLPPRTRPAQSKEMAIVSTS